MIAEIFKCPVGKVLEYIIVMRRPYTQIEVCKEVKLTKPTVCKVFKMLLDYGMIVKVKRKYKTEHKSPAVKRLLQFGMCLAFYIGRNKEAKK